MVDELVVVLPLLEEDGGLPVVDAPGLAGLLLRGLPLPPAPQLPLPGHLAIVDCGDGGVLVVLGRWPSLL